MKKWCFWEIKKSDFWGFSPDKAKTAPFGTVFKMVPLARIGLATPSLPMTCSTTEL